MIDDRTVLYLKSWFTDYVKTFRSPDPEYQRNIDLKEIHSRRVCLEILDIGKSLDLDQESLYLAEVMAFFHDIGRFEQYAHYGTFSDLRSENHALLGVKVLQKRGILEGLKESIRELILVVISYHNLEYLPDGGSKKTRFFVKLLRDADKLDIWRVVTDYYHNIKEDRNDTIGLDLPDTPEISEDVYSALVNKRIASISSLKTLNDFKLLQMGWVFDVNFFRTFQCIAERGYLEMIRDVLPQSKEVSEVYSLAQSYLRAKCPVT